MSNEFWYAKIHGGYRDKHLRNLLRFPSVMNLPMRPFTNLRPIEERRISSSTEDIVSLRFNFFSSFSSESAMTGYAPLASKTRSYNNAEKISHFASLTACFAQGMPLLCNPLQTHARAYAVKPAAATGP